MSHFDMDMMAMMGLIFLVGGVSVTFLKEMIVPIVGLFLLLGMVWGDDICSRNDRLSFYTDHFDRGGEIICKDTHARPVLISVSKGWELKGGYLFKGNQGVDILKISAKSSIKTNPIVSPLQRGSSLVRFIWWV